MSVGLLPIGKDTLDIVVPPSINSNCHEMLPGQLRRSASVSSSVQESQVPPCATSEERRVSPIAPRFLRETMRGNKRHFSVTKYDGNVLKKQMVC